MIRKKYKYDTYTQIIIYICMQIEWKLQDLSKRENLKLFNKTNKLGTSFMIRVELVSGWNEGVSPFDHIEQNQIY